MFYLPFTKKNKYFSCMIFLLLAEFWAFPSSTWTKAIANDSLSQKDSFLMHLKEELAHKKFLIKPGTVLWLYSVSVK